MIDDFDDGGKGNLYHLAVGAFDLDAGGSERLGSFHAAHDTAHTITVARYNFDIGFPVQRLQSRQGSGNFHFNYASCASDYTRSKCIRKPAAGQLVSQCVKTLT